eukprot:365884-Chlamydomonas_euryale.AAC.11
MLPVLACQACWDVLGLAGAAGAGMPGGFGMPVGQRRRRQSCRARWGTVRAGLCCRGRSSCTAGALVSPPFALLLLLFSSWPPSSPPSF